MQGITLSRVLAADTAGHQMQKAYEMANYTLAGVCLVLGNGGVAAQELLLARLRRDQALQAVLMRCTRCCCSYTARRSYSAGGAVLKGGGWAVVYKQ
jgi:hypothetical protein